MSRRELLLNPNSLNGDIQLGKVSGQIAATDAQVKIKFYIEMVIEGIFPLFAL